MTALQAPTADLRVESRTDRLVRQDERVRAEQAEFYEMLADLDASGEYEDEGYLSLTALLRDRLGISGGEASRRVAVARGLRRHPEIADAFSEARIDLPRVHLLLDAAEISQPRFECDQQVLIDNVSRLDMRQASRAISYWKQAADQRAAEQDAEHLRQRRFLHVSQTLGGMVRLDGELDPDGAQIVLTALRSLTDPQNLDPDDDRTPAQRRTDALVDLCADHLDHGNAPVSGQIRPHVSVIVSGRALTGRPAEPCEYDDATVITTKSARLVACDSTVTRVVMDGESQILDVGRATRTIPPAIRIALIARDRHCQWGGCDRPARWCDAHHIIHWADGGPTSLENLILLCRRHHRMAHEEDEARPWARTIDRPVRRPSPTRPANPPARDSIAPRPIRQ